MHRHVDQQIVNVGHVLTCFLHVSHTRLYFGHVRMLLGHVIEH